MPFSYVGDPTATESPSAAPGPGVAPTLSLPVDGDAVNAAAFIQAYKVCADFIAYGTQNISTQFYGDGSDADPNYSSATVTLSRDMFYANLTMVSSTINTAGFKVFVKGTLSMSASVIQNSASSPSATAAPTGTMVGGGNGGADSTAGGNAGTAKTVSVGGSGGAGGAGSSGAAGAAGTATAIAAADGSPHLALNAIQATVIGASGLKNMTGGAGGGGGGGDGGVVSGRFGGGGGGICIVAASSVVSVTGSNFIKANGSKGQDAGVGAGGGGGGGGGAVFLIRNSKTITAGSLTLQANGGALGTGGGTGGLNGVAGSNGTTIEFIR